MLSIKHITVAFEGKKVLDDLSLTFKLGEIVGLVAPNGTGKSTLINVIMNFLQPQTGSVTFKKIYNYQSKSNEVAMHQQISTFPEQGDLYDELSGYEHLVMFAQMWGNSKHTVDNIITKLQMGSYVKQKTKTYSLGMKQRLCFAMQLATDTQVMLMDEVMNGLDPNNMALISEVLVDLKKQNKLIIIASHLLDNLETYADRILFMDRGKIIYQRNKQHLLYEDQFLRASVDNYQRQRILANLPKEQTSPFTLKNPQKLLLNISDYSNSEVSALLNIFLQENIQDFQLGKLTLNELYFHYYLAT